jgi:hypothetical protein
MIDGDDWESFRIRVNEAYESDGLSGVQRVYTEYGEAARREWAGLGVVVGSNQPTYAEEMMADSQSMRLRADELIEQLDAASSPGVIADKAVQIVYHRKRMESRRVELKSPHDAACNDVQAAFQPWIDSLDAAKGRAAEKLGGETVRTAIGLASSVARYEPAVTDPPIFVQWLYVHAPKGLLEWCNKRARQVVRGGQTPEGVEMRSVTSTRFVR